MSEKKQVPGLSKMNICEQSTPDVLKNNSSLCLFQTADKFYCFPRLRKAETTMKQPADPLKVICFKVFVQERQAAFNRSVDHDRKSCVISSQITSGTLSLVLRKLSSRGSRLFLTVHNWGSRRYPVSDFLNIRVYLLLNFG